MRDFVVLVSSAEERVSGGAPLAVLRRHHDAVDAFPGGDISRCPRRAATSATGRPLGPHSSNESFAPIYYGKVVFIAYFNAGVRAVDIRDPFHPREIGFFIRRPRRTPTSAA